MPKVGKIGTRIVAMYVLMGLEQMLKLEVEGGKADLLVSKHTPNQFNQDHNVATETDAGACGPFVWQMAKELSQYLVRHKEAHNAWPEDLNLPDSFTEELMWDSQTTRMTIKGLVEREIRTRRYLNGGVKSWVDSKRGLGVEWV
jgi:hypothetical protein